MSFFDYQASLKLETEDVPFYALIMAAMRRADSDNLDKLKKMYPETWAELTHRRHTPEGKYPSEYWVESSPANSKKGG